MTPTTASTTPPTTPTTTSDWVGLSPSQHAQHHYTPRLGYHHATGQLIAPLTLAELPKALPHYVLAFVQHHNQLTPVALLGVEPGQNLYLHPDGRWIGTYVPASLRAYPFTLAEPANPKQPGDKTFSILADHLLTPEQAEDNDRSQPLFDNQQLTQELADTLNFLTQIEHNRAPTQAACQALHQADVLIPWTLIVPVGEGHKQLTGLYRVDEQRLNSLDQATYATLQGTPMQLAYAQLYSTAQVHQLTQRADLQQKIQEHNAPSQSQDIDLDNLFGEGSDDLFKF